MVEPLVSAGHATTTVAVASIHHAIAFSAVPHQWYSKVRFTRPSLAIIDLRPSAGEGLVVTVRDVAHADDKPPVHPALSDHEARVLTDTGFVTAPASATAARVDRDSRMQDLVRNSLSIPVAADLLGVAPARIRQRITDRSLWAFRSGRIRMLPPAQFTDTGAVPHIEQIAPLLAEDLHPLTVQALLAHSQCALTADGEPVSIVQWLTGSTSTAGDIERVIDLLTASEWEST